MSGRRVPVPGLAGAGGLVALLSDFGTADIYAGVMKGVIKGIAPAASIVDISHEIPPQDVMSGSLALLFSYRFFPAGTVFCCVVDPGVGSDRRAVAVEIDRGQGDASADLHDIVTENRRDGAVADEARQAGPVAAGRTGTITVVSPDNGLLSAVLELHGAVRAVELDAPSFQLPRVSATFHGRDIFAPVAAHLAAGVELSEVGSVCRTDSLKRISWPRPRPTASGWAGEIIQVDRFGNLISNLTARELGEAPARWRVTLGSREIGGIRTTFAEVEPGGAVAYLGSSDFLELAVRQGSAASEWRAGRGEPLRIERIDG